LPHKLTALFDDSLYQWLREGDRRIFSESPPLLDICWRNCLGRGSFSYRTVLLHQRFASETSTGSNDHVIGPID
jgi:hypothetical protein